MVGFGVRRIGGALLAGLLSYLSPQLLSPLTSTTLLPPILFGLGAMTLAQQPDGFMAVVGLSRQAGRARRALRRQRTSDPAAPGGSSAGGPSRCGPGGGGPPRAPPGPRAAARAPPR